MDHKRKLGPRWRREAFGRGRLWCALAAGAWFSLAGSPSGPQPPPPIRQPAAAMLSLTNHMIQAVWRIAVGDLAGVGAEMEGFLARLAEFDAITPPAAPMKALAEALRKDALALREAARRDEREALGPLVGKVLGHCVGCHALYRVR